MTLRRLLQLAAILAVTFVVAGGTASADPADTSASISFNPVSPVADGTLVAITGTALCAEVHGSFCDSAGKPVTVGSLQIQQAEDGDGLPLACADLNGGSFETIDADTPDSSGQFIAIFDTTGLAGMTIGFRAHYVTGGGAHQPGTSASDCLDLVILASGDPFPDGSVTYSQGFFGASPIGEDLVDQLIDQATCSEINDILEAIGEGATPYDCDPDGGDDLAALALFLTGTVGPGADSGFLPSGLAPGQNLAAQKIALLLNLNLGFILVAPEIAILSDYYLNIDVLQDVVDGAPGADIDPVFNNPELYDVCADVIGPDQICDPGFDLSPLGDKVALLDAAGTTVEDIWSAAYTLLVSGDTSVDVNGVTLTRGDVTGILGLINESYDAGAISGFVTAFDAD